MLENQHTRYGAITRIIEEAAPSALFFFVGDSSDAWYADMLNEFPPDQQGRIRVFADFDSANNACLANRGDVIIGMPGHAETLTTASDITFDTAGVTVIGMGVGNNRPKFIFGSSDNTASVVVSADNVKIKNIVGICGDDGLTNAFNVTGDNCELDIEWQDASSTVEAACAIRLDTANNSKVKLKYLGFTGGNAAVSPITIDDCDNVRIEIDGYGVVSTSWVDMVDAASTNVFVTGHVYTQGITNYSRDVTDTVTSSTWMAVLYDASAGSAVVGSSAAAFAAVDVSAVSTKVDAVQADLGNPSARTNLKTIEAMLGNPDVAAQSIWDALGGTGGLATFPNGAAPANSVSIAEVVRDTWDVLRNGTGGAEPATNRSVMDYLGATPAFFVPRLGFGVTKTCDLGGANDDLFTITGKVLITLITGEVTTGLSGAESFQLRVKTDNIALCAATTIDTDGDGTQYMLTGDFGDAMSGGATPVLRASMVNTLGGRGEFVVGDAGGTATIESNTTGNGGAILFTVYYLPLEAGAGIAAAA